jgi:hypothetical protein
MRTRCFTCTALFLLSICRTAIAQPPFSIPDRARGADRIVVAQVSNVTASYETNQYGDRLIVSHVDLAVEETLKGNAAHAVTLDVPGGTLGGLMLEASHEPKLDLGDRAVVFVKQNKDGRNVPYLADQGVLKLDSNNRIKGTTLDLDAVKQMVAGR